MSFDSLLPQPKPIKRSTAKRKNHKAIVANTNLVRADVFDRDDYSCRLVPNCGAAGVNLQLVHLEAKGMGGDHGTRTTTANCVVGCFAHHQGHRSLHSGHIKYRFLTDRGADGPMVFEYHEAIGQLPSFQGAHDVSASPTR